MRSSKINIIGLFACLSLIAGCAPHQASNSVLDPDVPAETPQSSEFIFPTEGQITQYFNPGHSAVDIAPLPGDEGHPEIMAVKAGTVSEVQINEKDGNFILIDHGDGVMTRYTHLDEVDVKEGDIVTQSQVIGTTGNTGRVRGTTGIHLHFELIKDGELVNPMDYLPNIFTFNQRGFVRLSADEGGEYLLDFDSIDWLTEAEGTCNIDENFLDEGHYSDPNLPACNPNGFLLVNDEVTSQLFSVDPNVNILMQTYCDEGMCPDQKISLADFAAIFDENSSKNYLAEAPYWVEVNHGTVVKITEQYRP